MVDQSLARSFEAVGEVYDRFRPGFPSAAAKLIVPDPIAVALDLGAGTGKFTTQLIERARRIIAVEPSEQMLAVLRARLPEVHALVGGAESIPVEDSSVDAVTVAQAFHWFDRDVACAEIHRVLVPGGALGLLWNHSDPDCAWDRACHRIAHPAVGTTDATTRTAAAELPGFTLVRREELSWAEEISRHDYLGRWGTVSSLLVADAESRTRMLAEIEDVLDAAQETRGRATFTLPMVTDVFVYRAKG
ncbi:MAG: class I SAM-dependent methyltransferase [Actinomycetota bacterium]